MLLSKQIQRRLYIRILKTISENKTDSKSLGHALQNFPYQVNLGTLLSSLKLLGLIMGFLIAKCISNLWLLILPMLMKLHKQLPSTIKWESTFPFMSCHWEEDQKHTASTQERLPNLQWQEDGDTHLDYTSTYSEMPGGLDKINTDKMKMENKKWTL